MLKYVDCEKKVQVLHRVDFENESLHKMVVYDTVKDEISNIDMNLNEIVNIYELEPDVDSVCMDENVILASDGMGKVFKFEQS